MFVCCAWVPLGFILFVAPMMAAGRGWRSLLWIFGAELGLLLLMALLNLDSMLDLLGRGQSGAMVLIGISAYFLLPAVMGAIVLWAKYAERDVDPSVCRVCGYDLRASSGRCPECGTPLRAGPDR